MIASKYSNPEVGRRNLETLAAATLEATLLQPDRAAPREEFLATMEELSAYAYQAYRSLVYETDGFKTVFRQMTPLAEITELNIGSRPASRTASDRIEENGIVAFITNRSFVEGRTFDGFRKVVEDEFNDIYIVDLGGDVRANPKLSGTKNNVFGNSPRSCSSARVSCTAITESMP